MYLIDALNTLVKGINKISFDVPDWVPLIGGKKFGFDIPKIPKLATGGLATAPTLAMVGDNKNAGADPEVIAPLSKLKNYIGTDDTEVLRLLERLIADVNSGTSSIVKAVYELITCLKNKKLIDSPEKFARDYKPYFDAESKRSGTNAVAGFVN